MSVFQGYFDRAAGDAGAFYTRKAMPKGLYEEPITCRRMFKYSFDRNSSVRVTKPIKMEDDDYQRFQSAGVHLKLNDELRSDAMYVYFESRKPVPLQVKEGLTARHGGYVMEKNIRFVATVTVPLANALNQLQQREYSLLTTKQANEK